MRNFLDPSTKKELTIACYSSKIIDGETKYFYSGTKKELVNSEGKPLIHLERKWDGSNVNFGKFSSMSKEDQRKCLKKRSKDDFKKNHLDKFHQMNKR